MNVKLTMEDVIINVLMKQDRIYANAIVVIHLMTTNMVVQVKLLLQ